MEWRSKVTMNASRDCRQLRLRNDVSFREAEAILVRSRATAEGLKVLSEAIKVDGGVEAASLRVAEQYIKAFSSIAKEGTTLLLPAAVSNPSSMIAQALSIYKTLQVGSSNGRILGEQGGITSESKYQDPSGTEAFSHITHSSTPSMSRTSTLDSDTAGAAFSLAKPHKET